ncbi:MAG: hypothetical protein ACR2QB_02945 [Gammaproteobacteria bacterium]
MKINSQNCRQSTSLSGQWATLAGLLLLGLLQACSPSVDEPASETPREGVFDDQIGTLDKAKSVEQQLKDSADAQRRSVEEQGG